MIGRKYEKRGLQITPFGCSFSETLGVFELVVNDIIKAMGIPGIAAIRRHNRSMQEKSHAHQSGTMENY